MRAQPVLLLLLALATSGCGERAPPDLNAQGSTTPPIDRAESEPLLSETVIPVRVGEQGPNFAACNARGATRDRAGLEVPVRAAPFDQAQEIDRLERGSGFFICSRTHDQRWFGIVYDEAGEAAERCGVSAPVTSRRAYPGPCAAGWVPSLSVRLVSGIPHQLAPVEPLPESTN
jgi:hypothetical protein